jgi:hypothetical protein
LTDRPEPLPAQREGARRFEQLGDRLLQAGFGIDAKTKIEEPQAFRLDARMFR